MCYILNPGSKRLIQLLPTIEYTAVLYRECTVSGSGVGMGRGDSHAPCMNVYKLQSPATLLAKHSDLELAIGY